MPSFLYTIFILVGGLWFWFYYYLTNNSPVDFDNKLLIKNVIFMLVLLFLALSVTFSVPVYFYLHKKAPTFTNLRFLYRKSLKWGGFFGFGIAFLLGLRVFELDNIINVALFLFLYFLIFSQLRSKR